MTEIRVKLEIHELEQRKTAELINIQNADS